MKKDKLVVSIEPAETADKSDEELASQFAKGQSGLNQWSVNPDEAADDAMLLYLWKSNGVGHMTLDRAFNRWADRTDAVSATIIHEYQDSIRE